MKKVIVTEVPSGKRPILKDFPFTSDWLFSFKDFNQMEYFGLNGMDEKWFISLLERLRDLSKIKKVDLDKDTNLKDMLRYHVIDWNACNIPIKRTDIKWVSKDIISNEEEFPFFQFHISKANGRVIGYWQENVFNIVLLDTMHNLQPTKYNDYKITHTTTATTDLFSLLETIEKIGQLDCKEKDCIVKEGINKLTVYKEGSNAIICFVDDDFLHQLRELSKTKSISVILEQGILALT